MATRTNRKTSAINVTTTSDTTAATPAPRKTAATKTAAKRPRKTATKTAATPELFESTQTVSLVKTPAAVEVAQADGAQLAADEFRALFIAAATGTDDADLFAVRVAFHNIDPAARQVAHVEAMIAASGEGANPATLATLIDGATQPIDGDPAVTLAQSLAALESVRASLMAGQSDSTIYRAGGIMKTLGADDATVATIAGRVTVALSRGRGVRNATGTRNRRIVAGTGSRSAGRNHVTAWLETLTDVTPGTFYPVADIAGRGEVCAVDGSPYEGGTPPSPNAIGNVVTGDYNDTPRMGEETESGFVWVGQCSPRGVVVVAARDAALIHADLTAKSADRRSARAARTATPVNA